MRSSNEMRDYNKAFVSTQLEFEARIAHAEARIAHAEVRAADERTARLKAEADSANERVARLKDREEFQQQTEEASKKIQSAHMEAEEANRKAEEANQKAEEANRKALEADRKAEAATHEINSKLYNTLFLSLNHSFSFYHPLCYLYLFNFLFHPKNGLMSGSLQCLGILVPRYVLLVAM